MRTSPQSYRCAIGKTEQRGNAGPRLYDATTDGLPLLLTHRCVGEERTVQEALRGDMLGLECTENTFSSADASIVAKDIIKLKRTGNGIPRAERDD